MTEEDEILSTYRHQYVLDLTNNFLLKGNDWKMQPSLSELLIALTAVAASLCGSFLFSKLVLKILERRRMRRREQNLFRGRRRRTRKRQ